MTEAVLPKNFDAKIDELEASIHAYLDSDDPAHDSPNVTSLVVLQLIAKIRQLEKRLSKKRGA